MKNLVFNLRTAKAQAEGCAKVTKSSRMAKILTTLTLLLTLGVGQMWANNGGFYGAYVDYTFGATSSTAGQEDDNDHTYGSKTIELGTLSSGSFSVTGVYLKCWDDWGSNYKSNGGLMGYNNKGGSNQELLGFSKTSKSGNNYQWQNTSPSLTLASYTDASGSYSFVCWFKTWWSGGDGNVYSGDHYYPTTSNSNYTFNYNIAPPAVSGFGVSASGFLAGSGTSEDPYLVASGSTLRLTASGSKAHNDANSSVNYKFGSAAYSTTATKNITVSSSGSIAVKARCINSSASLNGTETSTTTIYYAPVSIKDISVYIYVGDRTSAEINSVEMNGCTPYVGTKALSSVKINNQSAGAPKFTLSGNWLVYTFEDVTKVSNITCARSGGNIFTGEITDNVYYMYDGTALPGQCISRSNPTWGTAPASGAIGGSMTATVSGAPAGATITWTSTNTSAATVNSSGVISYEAAGNTTIKANVSWSASGDYCASSYELSQDITVTSGATVTATRTCPAYVSTGAGEVTLDITSTGASSGWYYRIKNKSTGGYYAPDNQSAASNALSWTMTGGIGAELTTLVVELYNGSNTLICTSSDVTVTGEIAHITYIAAGSNGSVSPTTIYANNIHVHPSITATPNSHYHFKNWTSNNAAASVASTKNATTTVTATAGGYTITAYFEGDQYTITYKDKDNAAYSGSNQASLPATHRYGTATALVNGVRSGYTFVGWYTNPECTGAAVTSIGATAQTGNFTLYAKWTEKMTTITVNVNPAGAGTLTVGGAAFTPGNTTTAGVETSRTVVATKANDYNFSSWSVTGNATGTSSTNTYTLKGNGSGSTGTLTANFTPIPCKLYKVSAAKNGTTTDKGAMTYDATEHAYYKDITTDASPYYFRFYYNNIAQYCTDWSSKAGGDAYTSGKQVVANGSKETCDQSVGGWGDIPAMHYDGESGTTIRIWFDYQNKKVWITADKDKQYVLRGANSDNDAVLDGMPGWDATTSYFVGLASGNTGTYEATLNGAEWYKLKAYDMYNKTWYGTTGSDAELIDGTLSTMGSGGNFYFGTTVDGTYTFTLDKSSGTKIKVDYPVSYQVQLEVGTVKGNNQTPGIYLDSYLPANKIENGSYVPAGSHVIFVVASSLESAAKTGYTWCGFFDNAAGSTPTQYTNNKVTTYHINTIAADAHVYACFYENDYTVTVNAGTGGKVNSLSSTTITGHKDTNANLPTATADPGYYFVNWTTTAGTLTNSTSATTGKINGLTSTATVTANFAPIWTIAGLGGDWDVDKLPLTNTYVDATVNYAYLDIDTLRPNTTYYFKAIQRSQGSPVWWRAESASNKEIKYTNSNTRLNMVSTTGDNFTLKTAGAGRYTFDVNLDGAKHPIKVHFPTSYTVTFGYGTGGSTVTAMVEDATTITTGQYAAEGKDITFTQTPATGYTFKGWYNAESEGSTIACMASDNVYDDIATSITVYAQYNPKTYTITLNQQTSATGYGTSGDLSLTATYGAAFPAATMPTAAEGYAFMGYYSEANGAGTQFTNASGVLLANITDYSDESGNWKYDGTKTLYAYYKKAEITGITFSPAAAEPGDEVTATAVISPNPTGSTMVCWEVRYASNNVLLDPQPTFDPENGASVTFTAPSAAVYKFTATLKTGSDCAAGTVLDTEDANLTVAGSHPVTIRYKHGDVVIKEETTQNIHATVATGISAPNIIGYSFSSWTLGDGITKVSGNLTDPSITVTAIYDGVITANYNPKRMIYFYNSLGWSSVNVYFYKNDSYWNNTNGTGADQSYTFSNTPYSEGKHGTMTRIDGTDIWYFDCEAAGVNASYDDVVFTELNQHGYGYFAKTDTKQNKVVRRGDYKSSMPMFVPVEQDGVSLNGGLAIYYNEGYWMNYPENTGYTVRIYNAWNVDMTSPAREYYFPYSSDKKMPLKLDVEFNTTDAKWFSIYRNDGVYLGVNALMTQASHTNYRIKDSNNKIKIQPSAPGIYTYTLTFYDDGEKDGSGKAYGNMYHITVDYPVSVGDFRILYSDNAEWSQGWAHNSVGHAWCHPSDAINKISAEATEAKKDTVSLFVSYGASPTAKFQYVSAINPSTGAVTWSDVDGGTISLSSITKSGTYNFIISQPVGGASVSVEKIEAYTGNYYIRTDCAGNTKWDSYRAADHQMTYSEFSCSEANSFGEKFSHYFTHWCPAGMNVKFVIANDYSSCISDTLIQDVDNPYANINSDGFLNSDGNPEETANRFSANIRFMYNEATNKISRAYVASSTNNARWFLVLRSNSEIQNEAGNPIEDIGDDIPSVIMDDKQNWIYEKTLKILPGSKFKLFACYAEVTPSQSGAQYFRGYWAEDDWVNSANTIELVGGSGSYQKVRVLYDFKTNRLVCAWLPDGDVTGEMNINADVMIIREHQEDATMITFTNSSSKLGGVKTVYGAMKFNRWILNNKSTAAGHAVLDPSDQKSIYERALYFISFPFDVNLGEVFGFGTYGVHWIIENYDGENRAKNGYWIDSPPNWKYVTSPKGYTLKANKGYILCLDLDLMKDDNEEFWPHGIETVELFFPSAVMQSTIEQAEVTIPAPDPAIYQCTINRGTPEGDRTIKDSYWRCLGVPSFANYTTTLSNGTSTITWQTGSTLPYLYAWNMENNTLTAQGTSTFAFKTMHAYLTQCSTAIVWTAASKPTPVIARYSENDMLKDREFRLELVENGVKADQTYIRLSAKEDVTSGFEFGNDLSKELNSGVSNIYTFIGYERAAANSLPLSAEQITIVPVGVVANAAGEYTFSMPDGTDGIGVTLIDEETGIRTSLSALDYTVDLSAGKHDSRFWLEISPVKGSETGMEEVTGDGLQVTGPRKVMIDGILYIVKDGKLFDARGARVE